MKTDLWPGHITWYDANWDIIIAHGAERQLHLPSDNYIAPFSEA